MLSMGSDQMSRQFQSDFGDRFWAMAQSGIQNESLDAQEVSQRDAMQQWLSQTPNSLHQEGGIQRFAAVLLFNPPGSVRLADPDSNLPGWFVDGFSDTAQWHKSEIVDSAYFICSLQLSCTISPFKSALSGRQKQ